MSIKLSNINLFYGSQQILFDINFTCDTGETIVLLGPSGAGKSSLLRVLNLLEIPQSGQLQINGQIFNFSQPIQTSKIRELRQNVGMVFQQYNLWPHLTVIDNLIEAPTKVLQQNKEQAKQQAMLVLQQLQLQELAQRYPLHLSGGQQQRVAIARALMMKPQILLFDEPTAALDPEITSEVANIINQLAKSSISQIIVTHEVDFAKKVATKLVYMENGNIIEKGNNSSFNHPATKEFSAYLSH